MHGFAAEMWRLVRPGGALAITTWGPGLFEPANTLFWDAVGEVEPSLVRAFNPWDEITTPAALAALFPPAAVPAVTAAAGHHLLGRPEAFWDIVLGSGYRATIDALSPGQRDQLRQRLLRELRSRDITTVRTDVIFATARRPG
jgi:hypothetical protein